MSSLRKRGLRVAMVAGAVLAGGGGMFAAAGSAGAAATQTDEITSAGSFTIYQLDHDLFANSVNDLAPGSTAAVIQPGPLCVTPPDYATVTGGAPNGSGAGKDALATEETAALDQQGCITFARSSSEPSSADPSTHLDYYAFALDGVAPMVGSAAGGTPTNPITLSLTQMKDIYNCTDTTWGQVLDTSSTTPIVRFWPQSGSGTRAVYTDMLGYDPTSTSVATACLAAGSDGEGDTGQPITGFTLTVSGTTYTAVNEENTEDGILFANTPSIEVGGSTIANPNYVSGALADAVYIYSAGRYAQQWNNTVPSTNYTSTSANSIATQLDNAVDPANGTNDFGNFDASVTSGSSGLEITNMENQVGTTSNPFLSYVAPTGLYNPNTKRGTESLDASTVKESNEWYSNIPAGDTAAQSAANVPGIRYVYNVADTATVGYDAAKALIGFDNQATGNTIGSPASVGAVSALCDGQDAATIAADGFLPLSNNTAAGGGATAPGSSDIPDSYCREFPGGAFPGQGGTDQWFTPTFIPQS